jgi:hypothetical protein
VGADYDASERDALCDELLDYLRKHPNAMDTLTGIAEWWLPRGPRHVDVERVAQALRALEERGVIERIGQDERALFRLRSRKPSSTADR